MDAAQWSQVKAMEEAAAISGCFKPMTMMLERKARPQKDEALNCPRCTSTNTKFCYYNNYSLTQPRYFCKTCRRYWTEGGTLRNVPVGGGSRKNKRSSSSSRAASEIITNLNPTIGLSNFSYQNPSRIHEGLDLNPPFSAAIQNYYFNISQPVDQLLPKIHNNNSNPQSSSSASCASSPLSAMELLKGAGITSVGLNNSSSISTPTPDSSIIYTPVLFPLQEMKQNLNFPLDGPESRYANLHRVEENGGGMVFPFGVLKGLSSTSTSEIDDQKKGQGNSSGYFNGKLGGGSW